ncbi:MAG: hypothetical protein BWK80_07695 [Desulfobacteraceae bacterium IS3]|nr:MAG: hypothetical protein BWK80_07695 [Desulfobacteraceae bacterium IS3]
MSSQGFRNSPAFGCFRLPGNVFIADTDLMFFTKSLPLLSLCLFLFLTEFTQYLPIYFMYFCKNIGYRNLRQFLGYFVILNCFDMPLTFRLSLFRLFRLCIFFA